MAASRQTRRPMGRTPKRLSASHAAMKHRWPSRNIANPGTNRSIGSINNTSPPAQSPGRRGCADGSSAKAKRRARQARSRTPSRAACTASATSAPYCEGVGCGEHAAQDRPDRRDGDGRNEPGRRHARHGLGNRSVHAGRPWWRIQPIIAPPGTAPGGDFATQNRTVAVSMLARGAPASRVWKAPLGSLTTKPLEPTVAK